MRFLTVMSFLAQVNGNWGEWSAVGPCDVTCGGGSQTRSRACNNPAPSNGGMECLLGDWTRGSKEVEKKVCNSKGCPGKKQM